MLSDYSLFSRGFASSVLLTGCEVVCLHGGFKQDGTLTFHPASHDVLEQSGQGSLYATPLVLVAISGSLLQDLLVVIVKLVIVALKVIGDCLEELDDVD